MAKKRLKRKPKTQPITESVTHTPDPKKDISIASLCSLKICRLCEGKDGPFLNIFEADKVIAIKIEELLPFGIAENDELPHKICFRCSAKLEELHEFIQKCIKTQHNLQEFLGKKAPLIIKTKPRSLWEERLNKSNISNDDICDAVIKKAMEGIQNIPFNIMSEEDKGKQSKIQSTFDAEENVNQKEITHDNVTKSTVPNAKPVAADTPDKSLSPVSKKLSDTVSKTKRRDEPDKDKISPENADECQPPAKKARITVNPFTKAKKTENENNQIQSIAANKIQHLNGDSVEAMRKTRSKKNETLIVEKQDQTKDEQPFKRVTNEITTNEKDVVQISSSCPDIKPDIAKTINIMDHVSRIKVNGVGILFQCKLCNRNFLKREFVISHGCAKTGMPREDLSKSNIFLAPPKVSTVKYINTKLDGDINKQPLDNNSASQNTIILGSKPKPKIGPASKIKRTLENSSTVGTSVKSKQVTHSPSHPNEPIVPTPSLSCRYKLVPGPNNTFSLVEEQINRDKRNNELVITSVKTKSNTQAFKYPEESEQGHQFANSYPPKSSDAYQKLVEEHGESERNDSNTQSGSSQPYPVVLIKSGRPNKSTAAKDSEPVAFNKAATAKPMYKVVKTDNPSKLLISSKPQPTHDDIVKSTKNLPQSNVKYKPGPKQHKNVNPPKNDSGFFTFVNVNPLLEPSYVLPTATTQELNVSTSIGKKPMPREQNDNRLRYSCNLCAEKFNREAKLLAHIQIHYNKIINE